jgi:aromatic-amino-acid transaminase
MFDKAPAYDGDPILSLQQAFLQDPRNDCVNLSIGLYYDDHGQTPLLWSVRTARSAWEPGPSYLPMGGDPVYCHTVQTLIFGDACEAVNSGRIATVQSVGGSGALKVGADFLQRLYPRSGVWVSDPTWDNHRAIFEGAGFTVQSYPYFDPASNRLDFDAMLASLSALPRESIVMLHPCCHNPTGADLSNAQWDAVIAVAAAHGLIPFMDMAYQGLGVDVEADAYAIRAMAAAGLSFLVSHSFSKIFSLYSERCGSLSVVCGTASEALRVHGQLQFAIRRNYSSPPALGARIVTHILNDSRRRQAWLLEVEGMRARIRAMRIALYGALLAQARRNGGGRDWRFLLEQRGLFSYAPWLGKVAGVLRERYGIYILESGRLCMAGITPGNVDKVAHAFAELAGA